MNSDNKGALLISSLWHSNIPNAYISHIYRGAATTEHEEHQAYGIR